VNKHSTELRVGLTMSVTAHADERMRRRKFNLGRMFNFVSITPR